MSVKPRKRFTLRDARQRHGLTQEALQEASGVDQTYISVLEKNGSVSPSMSVIHKLAVALKMQAFLGADGLWFEDR